MRPEYYTDPSTTKAGKARLAGGKPQPQSFWLVDLDLEYLKAGRYVFRCSLGECAKFGDHSLKWDSIVKHEDMKKHQEGKGKHRALQRSIWLRFAEP